MQQQQQRWVMIIIGISALIMPGDDKPAFSNELPKYKPGSKTLLEEDGHSLVGDYTGQIIPSAQHLYGEVVNAYTSHGSVDLNDDTVYTGCAGVALLHMKRGDSHAALSLLQPALQRLKLKYKDCTFLLGDCGPLAMAAIIYNGMGSSQISNRNQCTERILQMEKNVCESESLPNEMLYGRAGYLYTLLLLQRELGEDCINKQTIINVSKSILSSGLTNPDISQCPLTFTWHGKHYFGAAHGFAGIIYILLKVAQKYPEIDIDNILVPTIDFMITLKFPSGNYPSSLESSGRDKLVHWCHGAPGFIYMFVAAYEKYHDDRYKEAALDCVKLIWKRGLLRKGYGICHGVSGNAYAFLSAYKMTGHEKYLHMALQFALWCCRGDHDCRVPDRPFSLFEGKAGVCYFLTDILKPKNAKFPGFEL